MIKRVDWSPEKQIFCSNADQEVTQKKKKQLATMRVVLVIVSKFAVGMNNSGKSFRENRC